MEISKVVSGNAGPKVRSDCEISLELTDSGGIHVEIESKVKDLYSGSITILITEILHYFGIANANAQIKDSGALPYVIAARTEAAIKLLVDSEKEYLLPAASETYPPSSRHRFRFARLYLPGNNPSMMINAGLHSAEGLILDLEDSVAPGKKDEARILVRNAFRQLDFFGAERMIRINQGKTGIEDLRMIIPQKVDLVIIPKCESADEVRGISSEISRIKKQVNISNEIFLMPVIETAIGVENAYLIASSSPDVVAIAIGLEDYTADLGVTRTVEGHESFYARTRIVNAARAAGIQPIDSVFSDIDDLPALSENVKISKSLGFEGMGCIHPRQIKIIHQGFAPDAREIEKSIKIVLAFEEAKANGTGVICVGSKMIDAPVVRRAQNLINSAMAMGLLDADWLIMEMNKR